LLYGILSLRAFSAKQSVRSMVLWYYGILSLRAFSAKQSVRFELLSLRAFSAKQSVRFELLSLRAFQRSNLFALWYFVIASFFSEAICLLIRKRFQALSHQSKVLLRQKARNDKSVISITKIASLKGSQ
jgi:hypothetical protein